MKFHAISLCPSQPSQYPQPSSPEADDSPSEESSKGQNSLSLCHNVHFIYLTSSHYVGILSSAQEEG